jgi:pimeloyl-ACP methyl ester carboxylesterase
VNEARYRAAEDRLWASVGARPTERVLELSRTRVTVRMQEVGEGPPVVFIHGGSNCGASWASLVAHLDGFRCVLLDRPGCGLSPPLATGFDDVGRLATFADALLVDVLDALELERAHVVATSFGGYTALRSAAAHPDRIERLVELGYPIGAPVERVPLVMRVSAIPLAGRLVASIPPTPRAVRMIFRGIGLRQALEAGRITEPMLDWFLSMLRDTDTMRNELRAGPRVILPLRGLNEELLLSPELLATIDAPTFFLWGEEDPFGGADTAKAFVKHVPNAELELMPGAGHAVWMDDAEHVAKALRAFLTRSM